MVMSAAIGIQLDPMSDLGTRANEAYQEAHNVMTVATLTGHFLRAGLSSLRGAKLRRICIPKSFIQKLRNNIMKEAKQLDSTETTAFLSDNDIICAWWTKMVTKHKDLKRGSNIAIHNIHSFRKTFRKDDFENKNYVGNTLTWIPTLVSQQTVMNHSVGCLASAVRKSVSAMKAKAQVEAFVKLQRQRPAFMWPVFGDRDSTVLVFTNWTSCVTLELNFAALNKQNYSTNVDIHSGKDMRTECFLGGLSYELFPLPGVYWITEDGHNYILAGYERPSFWDRVQRQLEADDLEK